MEIKTVWSVWFSATGTTQKVVTALSKSLAEQLGAGLRLRKTTPDAIRAALEKAMDDTSYRENAEKIGASFRASGGAKAAADCIERRFLPEKIRSE